MEKSNTRPRRNVTLPETGSTKTTSSDATTTRDATFGTGGSRGNGPTTATGTDTRQRTTGAGTADQTKMPRGLQDTFLDERNDVLSVINELEDQLDRHQEIRASLERELAGTTEKLQSANQRTQELEWQVVTLQTRVEALEHVRQELGTAEEELSDANARAQRINEQLATTEKERTQLKNELKAVTKQLDELWGVRKERDGLRSDCKLLSAKVEELERSRRELVEERTAIQSQIQEAQAAVEEVRTERNQLQVALRTAEDRVRELVQVQEALNETIETQREEKKSLQAQIVHLERENARLIEQRQFYECELTALRNQNRTAEAALSSVKKAFTEVRVALTETKTRARRRALDTWPRIGSTLRGIPTNEQTTTTPVIETTPTVNTEDDDPLGANETPEPTVTPATTAADVNTYEETEEIA